MGIKNTAGFTIIEVMLFLVVTGALAAGILVGSGIAIGQQRYRDSVNSLKSVIQEQYNGVTNVVNDRGNNSACSNAAVTAPPDTVSVPQARGTSDCIVLGRAISLDSNGTQLTFSNVIGSRTSPVSATPVADTDVKELQNYTLGLSPIGQDSTAVSWSSRVVMPKTTQPATLTMLILRSPLSNSIFTFASTSSTPPTLNTLVKNGLGYSPIDLCVDGSQGSVTGPMISVRINSFASSASSIEALPQDSGTCN